MSFYERHILPCFTHLSMCQRQLADYRAQVIPRARGRVLEIGIGSGLNLSYYDAAVERVFGLDPSAELLRMAQPAVATAPVPVHLLIASAEAIPLETASVDTVVSTWTLCTIPHLATALREMRRVLRPGGAFLFVEHGLSPEPKVEAWQHRLTPVWKRIAGGCHLDRGIDQLIRSAGLDVTDLATGYAKGPRPFAYMYQGQAVPV